MRTIKRRVKFDQVGRRAEEGPIVLLPGERLASVQLLDASPDGVAIGAAECELKGIVGGHETQSFSTAATFNTGTKFRAVVGHTDWGVLPYSEIDFVVTAVETGYAAVFVVRLTAAHAEE